jgi:hypothetical protein
VAGRVIPEPYSYATTPHVRRHGPVGWNTYSRYREWLRDEFTFRCVYCLEREVWCDMRQRMHIDHFEPQAIRSDLKCEYTNLLYLCPACNSLKSDSILPDPCVVAVGDCLRVYKDGRIEALNAQGELLIDVLALDQPEAKQRRRFVIGNILSHAENNWQMFVEWMRYPEKLPDLDDPKNRPPHNDKPEGIAQSFLEKKRRGELDEVY